MCGYFHTTLKLQLMWSNTFLFLAVLVTVWSWFSQQKDSWGSDVLWRRAMLGVFCGHFPAFWWTYNHTLVSARKQAKSNDRRKQCRGNRDVLLLGHSMTLNSETNALAVANSGLRPEKVGSDKRLESSWRGRAVLENVSVQNQPEAKPIGKTFLVETGTGCSFCLCQLKTRYILCFHSKFNFIC